MDQNCARVDASITNLSRQLATWRARPKRFNVHHEFGTKHHDAQNTRIGAMIDADLNKKSGKPRSLQVKQRLGIEALSIANNSSRAALP
jgi:flagellin